MPYRLNEKVTDFERGGKESTTSLRPFINTIKEQIDSAMKKKPMLSTWQHTLQHLHISSMKDTLKINLQT
jgi:hypothetical protein